MINFILVQPSSTIFVYLLGMLTIGVGMFTIRIRENHRSRVWWSIALLLWGAGALFAGTSYQAFSYEIKCAGQALCSWTSWWEIIYLILSAASVDAMMIAVAYSSSVGTWRRVLITYALIHFALYVTVVLIGAFSLNKFLISFELLLIVAVPNIIACFLINGWRFNKNKNDIDSALLVTWLWLGLVFAGYFLYLTIDLTNALWERGIWFSENDVLHIGLMSWMLFLASYVIKRIVDIPSQTITD